MKEGSGRDFAFDGDDDRREPPSGKLHICGACGEQGVWGSTWIWYGSYRDLDDGKPIFKACSQGCMDRRKEAEERAIIAADIEAAKTEEQRLEESLARKRRWRAEAEAKLAAPLDPAP